jgi:hypothetical protein
MTTDQILAASIATTIRRWRREETTGASLRCLQANVRTDGLACSRREYEERFPEVAREVARKLHFDLY